jgi:hypothetical protein
MSARMESYSNNNFGSIISNYNNSNKGGQSDIEHAITNPQEPWDMKVQRVNHSDHVEDEGEDLQVVNLNQKLEQRRSYRSMIQSSCC